MHNAQCTVHNYCVRKAHLLEFIGIADTTIMHYAL